MDRELDVVWITTRKIKPGTYEEFRRAWRPKEFPEGMVWAYECFSEEANQVVGISIWDSVDSRERYRVSDVESELRREWERTDREMSWESARGAARDSWQRVGAQQRPVGDRDRR